MAKASSLVRRLKRMEPLGLRFKFPVRPQSSNGRHLTNSDLSQRKKWVEEAATWQQNYLSPLFRFLSIKEIWNGTQIEHLLLWIRGKERQHFGPKCRIQELFLRRDHIYFTLQKESLKWYSPLPKYHHDVFDVAAKVTTVEKRIGYEFKNKFLCIEALKATSVNCPLHFDGRNVHIPVNRRLALLGDRVLSLAVCELWYQTGNSTKEYSLMDQDTLTRVALSAKGRALGFDESILISRDSIRPTSNQVAETFEAILGAVYADSGNQLSVVQSVLIDIGLNDHRLLQTRGEVKKAKETKAEPPSDMEGKRTEHSQGEDPPPEQAPEKSRLESQEELQQSPSRLEQKQQAET